MSDTATIGLPEAAHQLGVSIRVLRRAIRSGKLPAPPHLTATSKLPAGWVQEAKAAIEASPKALVAAFPQKVPPFARFKGTSVWRQFKRRAREYADFRAQNA